MFELFTDRARQVIVFAQDEARALGYSSIGTEHILLGLMREDEGLAAQALEKLGVTLTDTRARVGRVGGVEETPQTGQIPFTPSAKDTLELTRRLALGLEHNHIGTEHLLLGLVEESEGMAARILLDFGVDRDSVRNATIPLIETRTDTGFSQTVAAVDVAIEWLARAKDAAEVEKHVDVAVELGRLELRLRELRPGLRD